MNPLNALRVLLVLSLCVAASCEDSAPSDDAAGDSGGSGGGEVCDPVGANPAVGELINAPVADDVEVVVKVPAHPGPAGPNGLP